LPDKKFHGIQNERKKKKNRGNKKNSRGGGGGALEKSSLGPRHSAVTALKEGKSGGPLAIWDRKKRPVKETTRDSSCVTMNGEKVLVASRIAGGMGRNPLRGCGTAYSSTTLNRKQ